MTQHYITIPLPPDPNQANKPRLQPQHPHSTELIRLNFMMYFSKYHDGWPFFSHGTPTALGMLIADFVPISRQANNAITFNWKTDWTFFCDYYLLPRECHIMEVVTSTDDSHHVLSHSVIIHVRLYKNNLWNVLLGWPQLSNKLFQRSIGCTLMNMYIAIKVRYMYFNLARARLFFFLAKATNPSGKLVVSTWTFQESR